MKKTEKMTGIVALAAFAAAFQGFAATYYVDNTLDSYDGHDGSTPEKALHRIQDAVDLTVSGDTVIVAPGIYGDDQGVVRDTGWGKGSDNGMNTFFSYRDNRVWIHGKHITLKSSGGADVTHIVGRHSSDPAPADGVAGVGDGTVRCIAMTGNDDLPGTRIEGFTIRDGGTAVYDTGWTYHKETNEKVIECPPAHQAGGILFAYTSSDTYKKIHVVDCVISNCVGGTAAAAHGVSLIRCRVSGNRTGRSSAGILRHCNAANCIFDFNGADWNTKEWVFTCADRTLEVVNCTFFGNKGCFDGNYVKAYNCLIQCNAPNKALTTVRKWILGSNGSTSMTNCVTDGNFAESEEVLASYRVGNHEYMENRANQAQLAAPLFGDFRPVANPRYPRLFGKGDKNYCSPSWIPEADRNKDFFGNPRWDGDNAVTAGAVQDAVEVAGGCLTMSVARYAVDGRVFDGPYNGYFYSMQTPSQYRIRPIPDTGKVIRDIRLGGYTDEAGFLNSYRFPDSKGEIAVTAPPFSSDPMTSIQPDQVSTGSVIWVDANYKGGDSDGSEEKPFTVLQDAVDASDASVTGVIMVRPGVYDKGGKYFWGMNRVYIYKGVNMRSTDGPEKTFIVGAAGDPALSEECGTNAYRCVAMQNYVDSEKGHWRRMAVVGFTLTGGRTLSNGNSCLTQLRRGAGVFGDGQNGYQRCAQVIDCVITGCNAVRASAAFRCWLQNCRIYGNRNIADPSSVAGGKDSSRGVVWESYLSNCIGGPNTYTTVAYDTDSILWNCTIAETTGLRLSKDCAAYNTVLLNNPTTQSALEKGYAGLVFETTGYPAHTDYTKISDAKLAEKNSGDYRPLADSPLLSGGTTNGVPGYFQYTLGGVHGGTFSGGQVPVGAAFDVATPVTLSHPDGVSVVGGLGTLFVSKANPLTLTSSASCFRGWLLNGEKVAGDGNLVVTLQDGVTSYTVGQRYTRFAVLIR